VEAVGADEFTESRRRHVQVSDGDIFRYATELFPMLSGSSTKTLQIPASGMYQDAWVGKQAVLIPDLEKNRQLLENTLKAVFPT
jgi:hypothetical protein